MGSHKIHVPNISKPPTSYGLNHSPIPCQHQSNTLAKPGAHVDALSQLTVSHDLGDFNA
jgi:hypothetical protein